MVGVMAIYALGDIEPEIHADAYVHPDATVIGRVTLGEGASVWPGAVLRGDSGHIVIGARTSVQDGTVIHCTEADDTIIGADCTVGHCAHLEGCTVGDGALIGSGSIVLNGASIGAGALVAAGAVVGPNKVVPARARAIGVPARITEDAVSGAPDHAVEIYVAKAARYRQELRRID
jgi:carbonic anhydrase/acetyltransferase-like protein (isoleucine patch superfamily)